MAANAVELHESVLVALRRIIRAIDLHSRQLINRHGLTGPQLILLRHLTANGQMPIGELAKAVSLSHPTVTGIVSRLEQRGYVERTRGERDKRQFLLAVTEKARETINTAPPLLQEQFTEQFGKLAEWEQTQILASLQKIVGMMEAEELDAAPILVIGEIQQSGTKRRRKTRQIPGGGDTAKATP